MQTLLLVPTGENVGLTSACLGLIYALDCQNIKAGFVKPFSQEAQSHQSCTATLCQKLFQRDCPTSITHERILNAITHQKTDELLEEAVHLHREVAQQHDIIVVEGLYTSEDSYFAHDLNVQLAKALDAQVIFVSKANLAEPQKTAERIDAQVRTFSSRQSSVLFMRTRGLPDSPIPLSFDPSLRLTQEVEQFTKALQAFNPTIGTEKLPIIGLVPFSNTLSVQRTCDILPIIDGQYLNEGHASQRRVLSSCIVASSIEHELSQFVAGKLIITGSERTDVLLASSIATQNGIPLAGLVLAERHSPASETLAFCQNALQQGLPVIHTPLSAFETAQRLQRLNNEIPEDDVQRAEQVTRFVSSHLNMDWLNQTQPTPRLSPAAFRYELVKKSIADKKRIVLPEGDEPRTIEAAIICQSRGIANCVLLAKPQDVQQFIQARNLSLPKGLEIINPETVRDQYVDAMVEKRKGKLDALQAKEQLQDTVVLGTMMLALDHVDGLVSGAVHTTANTVRPAFQLIKTAPNYSLVSSIFFMLLPDEVYVYGDCAINPDPNAEQLAEIAIQSADSAKAFGIDPRIAMISYSTGASGAGADVEKVKQATDIAKQKRPDLLIDGPLQYDAASVESVGRSKAPHSDVAGRANVFIFPDLNTGNTTYKAVQRSANVISVGPMLQGLNKPVNDLSRGALVDDIVFTIALTAIQAQS
ncbi:phosphate acetyltransferase [Acinetobacter sp. HY1485]|uniref:phosphate acetyltransferase n=1 Tax=Acinetobacter sp. HY1485 TaxID=2970918 RepID=UPI0022B97049|nr:phosphate acetyltransferase [Acinetobacter sp. HY1485]